MSDSGDAADATAEPISVESALEDLNSSPPEDREFEYAFEEEFSYRSVEAETLWTKLQGLKDHFKHKKIWSWALLVAMIWMVLFQSGLLVAIGLGKLDFASYDWLLPTVMIQYLAQIVGLAVFVVRSLFKDMN